MQTEWRLGFYLWIFHIVDEAAGRLRAGGGGRGCSDLSDTSSPSFRTESQYSKLLSADKKK